MKDPLIIFEERYVTEVKEFYSPHFPNLNSLNFFISRIFEYDWDDRKPRQMLFQVQRFVTLVTKIDKICPARDGLRMLFLKCCLEALSHLSSIDVKAFYNSFGTFFSVDGKNYILNNFS